MIYNIRLLTFSICVIWVIPYMYLGMRASYGSNRHIVFMDKQLSKTPNEYHSLSFYDIGARHHSYSIRYPFIAHRVKTKSIKFRLIMWLNFLWFWSLGLFVLLSFFDT